MRSYLDKTMECPLKWCGQRGSREEAGSLNVMRRGGVVGLIVVICLTSAAAQAVGKEFPYTLNPELSLTGECNTSAFDSVVDPKLDPDCPYPLPPGGPSARFGKSYSVAVDAYGNLYVASYGSNGEDGRVDIFDEEGHFLTEFADPHGPESIAVDGKGNLYVFEWLETVIHKEVVRYPPKKYEPEAGVIEYSQATRTVINPDLPGVNGVAIDTS